MIRCRKPGWQTLAAVLLWTGSAQTATVAQQILVTQSPAEAVLQITVTGAAKNGIHRVQLDDTPAFRTPMSLKSFHGNAVRLQWIDEAMVPGLMYYVRVDGGAAQPFRLLPGHEIDIPPGVISCRALRRTWEVSGRFDVGTALSGLTWVGDHWAARPHTFLPGESLYNVESVARPAILAARYCDDMETLNDLSLYYLEMLTQTETVAAITARPNLTEESRLRLRTTDQTARTFSASFGKQAGEGELFNAQWLYPAALLVRVVTTLPTIKQTQAMREFATQYAGFAVTDQLLRYLFQQQMPALAGHSIAGRVARWQLAMSGAKGAEPWDADLSDIDLWLIASATEMLGAHANDPALVPVSDSEVDSLREAVTTGLLFLQTRRALHPETKNFDGQAVGSTTYFAGEYASHSDMAYSAVSGQSLPTPDMRKGLSDISWDSSHVYRLAVLFRSLYENRKVLARGAFPQTADIRLLVNQYVYRVFNGDFRQPLFSNYFDGSDGWFRVDYDGSGSGVPPSKYCNMRDGKRPCLTNGELRGWGELAFLNPDLEHLETALMEMAFRSDVNTKKFRDRYYFSGSPFQRNVVGGQDTYGGLLYGVVAENAGLIQPRQAQTVSKASEDSKH